MPEKAVNVIVRVKRKVFIEHEIEYRAEIIRGNERVRFDSGVVFTTPIGGTPLDKTSEGKQVMFRTRSVSNEYFQIKNIRAYDSLNRNVEIFFLGSEVSAFIMPGFGSTETKVTVVAEVDLTPGFFAVNLVEGPGVISTFINNTRSELSPFKLALPDDSITVGTNINAYYAATGVNPTQSNPTNSISFVMPSDNVSIRFTQVRTHSILINQDPNNRGFIRANREWAGAGEEISISVTPSRGWYLSNWILNSASLPSTEDDDYESEYSFIMPDNITTISGNFDFVRIIFEWNAADNLAKGIIPVGSIFTNNFDNYNDNSIYQPVRNVYKDYALIFSQFHATFSITEQGAIKIQPGLFNACMSIGLIAGPGPNASRHVPGQFDFYEGTYKLTIQCQVNELGYNATGAPNNGRIRTYINAIALPGPLVPAPSPGTLHFSDIVSPTVNTNGGITEEFSRVHGRRVGTGWGTPHFFNPTVNNSNGPIPIMGGSSNFTLSNPGSIRPAMETLKTAFINFYYIPSQPNIGDHIIVTGIKIERTGLD